MFNYPPLHPSLVLIKVTTPHLNLELLLILLSTTHKICIFSRNYDCNHYHNLPIDPYSHKPSILTFPLYFRHLYMSLRPTASLWKGNQPAVSKISIAHSFIGLEHITVHNFNSATLSQFDSTVDRDKLSWNWVSQRKETWTDQIRSRPLFFRGAMHLTRCSSYLAPSLHGNNRDKRWLFVLILGMNKIKHCKNYYTAR